MSKNEIALGLKSQLLASLYMLKDCIDRCPENQWDERHNDYPFSQVVFHTLFDCDLNLSENEKELKEQKIHSECIQEFGDYSELEGRITNKLYPRDFILKYYLHCISKTKTVMEQKTNEELLLEKSDYYKTMTKMERYVNCIRHTQHHAAQLGLRLQIITGKEMIWVGKSKEIQE